MGLFPDSRENSREFFSAWIELATTVFYALRFSARNRLNVYSEYVRSKSAIRPQLFFIGCGLPTLQKQFSADRVPRILAEIENGLIDQTRFDHDHDLPRDGWLHDQFCTQSENSV